MNRKKALRHGTISTYTNYLCRCGRCRAAAAKYQSERRRIRAATLKEGAA